MMESSRRSKMPDLTPLKLDVDTTNYGGYMRGGIVTRVKQLKVLKLRTVREALNDPDDYLLSDFSKFDRPPLLLLAFQALDKFTGEVTVRRFPAAVSEEDAQKLISVSKIIN
ncbi:hypothetical protein MKW92_028992 [Papaver armeniacum]|nr:hypothetical protein MKW92_028992 [Papaver armeniacum]